jgi:hypothetical protein
MTASQLKINNLNSEDQNLAELTTLESENIHGARGYSRRTRLSGSGNYVRRFRFNNGSAVVASSAPANITFNGVNVNGGNGSFGSSGNGFASAQSGGLSATAGNGFASGTTSNFSGDFGNGNSFSTSISSDSGTVTTSSAFFH